MNNLNNPLKLSDIIDRCLLRMAQSVNSFLDADNAMRSRLTSFIGFVITLYTLHNVEVRLRLLSVYARPLYTIAALSVLFFVAYMLLFRFAGASQINGWTSLKRTFTTQNLLFLIVCFVFAFVIYNQLFKSRKHISKPTTSFDTINLSNSKTPLNQSAIINKTIEQNAVGFNSTVFMSMISAIYHRLQKQSSCKPVEFLDLVNNYARCKNDDQDLSITSRIEAEKLFGYLSSFRSTVDEEKKLVVKNDSSESILSNLLNNLSKSSEWAQEQQREKLNQLNSHPTASISFPNLLDFWKFMIKIFLTTVILLIVTYLIIRVLLWLIENVLRPNGNGEKGSSRRTG